MSPLIELVVFFLICVVSWGWLGLLIFVGVSAAYCVLLYLLGRLEPGQQRKKPPR
jgi:hypothetical protein